MYCYTPARLLFLINFSLFFHVSNSSRRRQAFVYRIKIGCECSVWLSIKLRFELTAKTLSSWVESYFDLVGCWERRWLSRGQQFPALNFCFNTNSLHGIIKCALQLYDNIYIYIYICRATYLRSQITLVPVRWFKTLTRDCILSNAFITFYICHYIHDTPYIHLVPSLCLQLEFIW